jgi:DNA-binding cell septation regulator SpoVG
MNMKVTEVRIYPTNEKMAKAYATIVFDNCLMIREIKVIESTMGLSSQFPRRSKETGAIAISFSGQC